MTTENKILPMTSRQRIRSLLNGKNTDRLPCGLLGSEASGMHVLTYEKFKKILDISPPNKMYSFMTNSVSEPEFLEAVGGDIITLQSNLCPSSLWSNKNEGWKVQRLWDVEILVPEKWNFEYQSDGSVMWDDELRCPPDGYYFDYLPTGRLPFDVKRQSPKEYKFEYDVPDERLKYLQRDAKYLFENTDYAISTGELTSDLQLKPGGIVDWMMRMIESPNECHDFLYKATEAALSQLKLLWQAIGNYCDMGVISDDIGSDRGVLIGPELWCSIYKPHYKVFFAKWHDITDAKIIFHSCGSIIDIIDDLVECGVDILNPVQTSARGMEISSIQKINKNLILYGGAYDAITIKPHKSYDEVYRSVYDNIVELNKNDRYIFTAVHNLPPEMPQAHIRAFLDAYNAYNENFY